jgi:hypothetical protein
MKRVNVFGFPIEDRPPDYSECTVALVDALRDYVWRLQLDSDGYDEDARAAGELPDPKTEHKFNLHLQTVKLLLKELEKDEVDPALGERLKR